VDSGQRAADSAGRAHPLRPRGWLWAVVAAAAIVGWQLARRGRARARERAVRHELDRWEGEGGQVIG
jgi:hypothetical protein